MSWIALIGTLVLWLLSLGQHEHYFESIHTLIRLANGEFTYSAPNAHGFRYPIWRALVAGVVLVVSTAAYPLLRDVAVVCGLAVLLNFFTCGTIVDNPYSVLCVFAFDIVLFIAALNWSVTRRGKAAPGGICTKCGYDLRATPDRCPECGTEVPSFRKQSEKLP